MVDKRNFYETLSSSLYIFKLLSSISFVIFVAINSEYILLVGVYQNFGYLVENAEDLLLKQSAFMLNSTNPTDWRIDNTLAKFVIVHGQNTN